MIRSILLFFCAWGLHPWTHAIDKQGQRRKDCPICGSTYWWEHSQGGGWWDNGDWR